MLESDYLISCFPVVLVAMAPDCPLSLVELTQLELSCQRPPSSALLPDGASLLLLC